MTRKGIEFLHARDRRAFTLAELLVGIAITSLLISLALPALGAAQRRSRHASSLSLQRQLIAGLSLYTASHADAFPYFGTPGEPTGPILVHGVNVQFQGYFADQRVHWLSVIVPDFAEIDASRVDHRGVANGRGVIRSLIQLTECAFADSKLFSARSDGDPPLDYFRATRAYEILHPSAKGLTLDVSLGEPNESRGGWLSGFSDGSAREVPAGTPSRIVHQPYSNSASPVLNTLDGLAGVDFR